MVTLTRIVGLVTEKEISSELRTEGEMYMRETRL